MRTRRTRWKVRREDEWTVAMARLLERAELITTTSTLGLVAIRIALEAMSRLEAMMREDTIPRATIGELQAPTTKTKTRGESKRETSSNTQEAVRKVLLWCLPPIWWEPPKLCPDLKMIVSKHQIAGHRQETKCEDSGKEIKVKRLIWLKNSLMFKRLTKADLNHLLTRKNSPAKRQEAEKLFKNHYMILLSLSMIAH